MPEIRTVVLGILTRGEEYLVQRLDLPESEPFHRPIGGGVEFGESSAEAIEREFREELDLAVRAGPAVGTVENRFRWDGDPKHEVGILRAVEFADPAVYDRERFSGVDDGGAVEYEATWHTVDDLRAAREPLYPEGLADLLAGEGGQGWGHLTEPEA
jgi:ADP-ribose pyrophosphatase YjhB (NUDIX family)